MDSKPDLLIIGAAKSGTTSLARNLNSHPQISILPREIHYFSRNLDRGDDWYLSFFKASTKIQGEKSPSYLYYTACHAHIYRLLPEVKLIILLRDPVERAFSNWNMRYNDNRLIQQGLTFNKNYANTLASLDFDKLLDYYLANRGTSNGWPEPLDIFHRGLYIRQIENLLKFYNRNQLLVLITEQFFTAEGQGYDEVCRFLDTAPFKPKTFERLRVGDYNKTIPWACREKLRELYQPYNQALFELLGQEIREWQ